MSDVTEPSVQAYKGGARGWRAGRRVAKRADSKLFLFKKKKLCAARSGFFFFPRLLSSSPLPLLPFESFFFFPPSLTAWLIQLQCQSTFFPPLPHLNKFKLLLSRATINLASRATARESQKGEGPRELACGTPDRRAGGCAFPAPGPSRPTRSSSLPRASAHDDHHPRVCHHLRLERSFMQG